MPHSPTLASQNGEDHLILQAFKDQRRGFFVDVGAFDGIHLSNTWALEQIGWTGICVEPSPRVFALLSSNRPSSVCVDAAAGAQPGKATLFMDPTMLLSSLGAKDEVMARYEDAAKVLGLDSDSFVSADVRVVTLNDLLRRSRWPGRIDVLSIDVEGAEEAVLDGLDLANYRPRLLIIKAKDEAVGERLQRRLDAAGYSLCRSLRHNMFFAEEEAVIWRLINADVNCFLPRNLHPFGPDHTHPDQLTDRVILHGHGFPLKKMAALQGPRISPEENDLRPEVEEE